MSSEVVPGFVRSVTWQPSPDDLRLVREDTTLIVVDVQEKLAAVMPDAVRERTIKNVAALVEGARVLGVPVLVTEQYPKGLGPTVAAIREALAKIEPPPQPIEKIEFDACSVPAFAT